MSAVSTYTPYKTLRVGSSHRMKRPTEAKQSPQSGDHCTKPLVARLSLVDTQEVPLVTRRRGLCTNRIVRLSVEILEHARVPWGVYTSKGCEKTGRRNLPRWFS